MLTTRHLRLPAAAALLLVLHATSVAAQLCPVPSVQARKREQTARKEESAGTRIECSSES